MAMFITVASIATTKETDSEFTSTPMIFTSEFGKITLSLMATISSKTEKALKALSRMESKALEDIAMQTETFMKESGETT